MMGNESYYFITVNSLCALKFTNQVQFKSLEHSTDLIKIKIKVSKRIHRSGSHCQQENSKCP